MVDSLEIIGFCGRTITRLFHREINKINFTYSSCSIINISINTHEIH